MTDPVNPRPSWPPTSSVASFPAYPPTTAPSASVAPSWDPGPCDSGPCDPGPWPAPAAVVPTPEPSYAHLSSTQPRRMERRGVLVALLGVMTVGVGAAVAFGSGRLGWGEHGPAAAGPHRTKAELPADVAELVVVSPSTDVHLSGSDTLGVDVAWNDPGDVPYAVTTAEGATTVSVRPRADSVDVSAPSATGLTVRTSVADLHGAELTTAQLTVSAGSGDVRLEFARAPRHVVIQAGSGNVELILPTGSYRFDVAAPNGNVDVPKSTGDRRIIEVRAGSGDVIISAD